MMGILCYSLLLLRENRHHTKLLLELVQTFTLEERLPSLLVKFLFRDELARLAHPTLLLL